MKAILKKFYFNHGFVSSDRFVADEGSATYDVLRVIEGKPLFLMAHIERVNNSLVEMGYKKRDDIRAILDELIFLNGQDDINCNVKILAGGDYELVMGFIESHYPPDEAYVNGVSLCRVDVERKDPSHKVWNDDYKVRIANTVREQGVFEALLNNRQGLITEGSKSNIFFVRDGIVLTPAAGALPGITKSYVEKTIFALGIPLEKTDIERTSLDTMQAAFLTGTSLNILPINKIEDRPYDVNNSVLRQVMQSFRETVQKDLEYYEGR